jgi:Holliday junction resolvase
MGAMSRRKGKKGEQDVARIFREAGHTVMQLQRNRSDMADLLVNGRYYVDSKNANIWKLAEWVPTLQRVTPAGSVPVLALHRDGETWWVLTPLRDYVKLPL